MLPHRYPLLLLDTVIELVPGQRVVATKAISCGEPWYRDVADDVPPSGYAYPQVLLIESWCQCAALLAGGGRSVDGGSGMATVPLFGGVFGVSFDGEAYPGDVLEHRARLTRQFGDTWIFSGETVVGSVAVLRVAEAIVALRPPGVLASTV